MQVTSRSDASWTSSSNTPSVVGNFDLTFGAVSQHLALLRRSGLVEVRPEGNRRLYRANREALGPLRPILEAMWEQSLDSLARLVEEEAP